MGRDGIRDQYRLDRKSVDNQLSSSTAPACVHHLGGPGSVAATELLCPALSAARRDLLCSGDFGFTEPRSLLVTGTLYSLRIPNERNNTPSTTTIPRPAICAATARPFSSSASTSSRQETILHHDHDSIIPYRLSHLPLNSTEFARRTHSSYTSPVSLTGPNRACLSFLKGFVAATAG